MITYAEARRLISEAALARPALSEETVPLSQALGRVCATELFGREPIPPFDNSAMDGYALAHARAAGASSAPLTIPVLGTIFAGDAPRCQAEAGAWKIMTGAPIPAGCDAVIPVEQTRPLDGGRAVELLHTPNDGDFIRGAGQDFGAGAQVCPAGTRLGPRHLMALAAVGLSSVPVRRRPRIALIATGRELTPPDEPLGPGKIRDASSAYLAAECERLGVDFYFHGIVADDAAAFSARMELALGKGYDAILTTGAVSMGDADFIPKALQELGAELIFHKVAIKPGRPILFAQFKNGPFVFGLPGNPVSSVVGMRFFVQPCLRDLMGQPEETPLRFRLASKTEKPEGLRCFFKARRGHGGSVEILPAQASFQIHSLLAADCWAVLPEEGDQVKTGAEVDVYEA
ncbi:MAG: molybdopterin molybdenumtransferase MoeA [Elusimicrobia bacterium CG11_big_fil_rev_8_21_14_0_20_64_6]|nr:MAG: molybdopterin molybdenumtransferase MoeA [Elusimicrobia bacterium CG11_big_fil_rev_8_21_14_0_20_64_6]